LALAYSGCYHYGRLVYVEENGVGALTDQLFRILEMTIISSMGVIIIIWGHQWIDPLVVFSAVMGALGVIIGARITNGYLKKEAP